MFSFPMFPLQSYVVTAQLWHSMDTSELEEALGAERAGTRTLEVTQPPASPPMPPAPMEQLRNAETRKQDPAVQRCPERQKSAA
jgi:hypothetical protein